MENMRPWIAIGLAGILMGGGFLALPPTIYAQEKTIVWNIPHTAAPTYYKIINLNLFAEKVK
jgi:hypothetical protein